MRLSLAWRWTELRMLLPLLLLVPLGFVVTHIAEVGKLEPGPLTTCRQRTRARAPDLRDVGSRMKPRAN